MSTADLAIESIELDASVSALSNLAKVSALAAAVKQRTNVFSLAWHLRKVSTQIKEMLDRTNGIIERLMQPEMIRRTRLSLIAHAAKESSGKRWI
jgi:hypothetical protein